MKKHLLLVVGSMMATQFAFAAVVKMDLGFITNSQIVPEVGQIKSASGLLTEEQFRASPLNTSFRPRPNFVSVKDYDPLDDSENLEVFRSETTFVVSKERAIAYLQASKQINIVQDMGGGFVHNIADTNGINSEYQATLAATYKSATDTQVERRTRATKPISEAEFQAAMGRLNHHTTVASQQVWCGAGKTCLRSSVDIGEYWRKRFQDVAWIIENTPAMPASLKSKAQKLKEMSGITMDGEIYQATPDANGRIPEVQFIPVSPMAVIVQTGFKASTFIQFTKAVVSFHDLQNGQVLVVMQSVVGLEKDDLDMSIPGVDVRSNMMSQGIMNGDSGLSMGLPRLQEQMAQTFKNQIETKPL